MIYEAAAEYGVSGDWMYQIALCESGLDPNALGIHGEVGLFQFMPETFFANGGENLWNPWEQAHVAARMLSEGQSYQWLCA
jgi:hypothetical protein